jgi:hypothetical protein
MLPTFGSVETEKREIAFEVWWHGRNRSRRHLVWRERVDWPSVPRVGDEVSGLRIEPPPRFSRNESSTSASWAVRRFGWKDNKLEIGLAEVGEDAVADESAWLAKCRKRGAEVHDLGRESPDDPTRNPDGGVRVVVAVLDFIERFLVPYEWLVKWKKLRHSWFA